MPPIYRKVGFKNIIDTTANIISKIQGGFIAIAHDVAFRWTYIHDGISLRTLSYTDRTLFRIGTVAELITIPTNMVTNVTCSGYWEDGDGKSFKQFKYSPVSTATVNNGSVFATYNGVGRWLAVYGRIINPYQFGAKGTGLITDDDISAMEAARDFAIATRASYMHLPDGTFGISRALDLSKENWPTEKNGAKGFFTIRGNGRRTRIIPLANIDYAIKSIQLSADNNLNGAAGAAIRRLTLENFTLYSDNRLNDGDGFTFTEGVRFNWVADVYVRDVDASNAVTKSALAFDSCFPIEIDNCNLYGENAGYADTGYDTPSAIEAIRTYNVLTPPSPSDDLCGVRFTGICTTTWMKNCRVSNFINGVCVGGMEMLTTQNCAIESNKSKVLSEINPIYDGRGHGVLVVDGAVTVINMKQFYAEGNECTIGIKSTFQGGSFTQNYFHDPISFRFYPNVEISGLKIHDNHIKAGEKLFDDQGGRLIDFGFYNNEIFVERYYKDTFWGLQTDYTTVANRNKISVYNNFLRIRNSNDHIPILNRDTSNLSGFPLSEWQINGDATITVDPDRYLNNHTYKLVSTSSGNISRNIFASLPGLDNRGLRNCWFTMGIPVHKIGTSGNIKYTMQYKNSGVGSSTVITGRADIKSMEVTFENTTHYWAFDGLNYGVAVFEIGETLSWSGGTGKAIGCPNTNATGVHFIKLLTGTLPADNALITGGSSGATALVNGSVTTANNLVLQTLGADFEGFTKIRFSNSGGSLPTGLTAGIPYFLGRLDEGVFWISLTKEDADKNISVAYTNVGSGTQTMYQYDYWVMNYVYFKIPEDAEFLRVTIDPQIGSYVIGQPTIFKGLWGDEMGEQIPEERLQIRPSEANAVLFEAYDNPDHPTKKTIVMKSLGSPGYGIIEVRNNDLASVSMHGTRGFVTENDRNYIIGNASREMAVYHHEDVKFRACAEGMGLGSAGPAVFSGAGEPSTPIDFTASSYGILKIAGTTDIPTGTNIRFASADPLTQNLPTGLVAGTNYYAIRLSATEIQVATSLINANLGVAIPYTDAGTGVTLLTIVTGNISYAVTPSSDNRLLLTYSTNIPGWHRVRFSTTGTLPTGLAANTNYWVIRMSATTCMVATSLGNAQISNAIAYTNNGSPTNRITLAYPQGSLYCRTDGSSTTTRLYVNTNGITSWTNLVTGA